jgi:mono/diheme cytochrome c family protein
MEMMRPPRTVRRATTLAVLLVAGCQRDQPAVDLREPLGAHIVGAARPALPTRARGAGQPAVIPATASLPAAAYTAEQASRGAQVYQATCARCHPPGQLDGEAFAVGWNEARASTLFNTLRNTMPQDKPGSLSDGQYADVIAYLLQRNRVPPGAVALTTDTAALRQLRIAVSPPGAAPAATTP